MMLFRYLFFFFGSLGILWYLFRVLPSRYFRNVTYLLWTFFMIWFVAVEFIRLRVILIAWYELGRMPTYIDANTTPKRWLVSRQFDETLDIYFIVWSIYLIPLIGLALFLCNEAGLPVSKFVLWSFVIIVLKAALMRLGLLPFYAFFFW